MTAIPVRFDEVRIKHQVLGVPPNKTADQIESDVEYYKWRIYIEGDPLVLQRIERVIYRLDPSFPRPIVETIDWQNQFEYSIFGYGSFDLEFMIYVKGNPRPYTGYYHLDISRSNNVGEPVRFG